MSKLFFYFKLAATNLKKNSKIYLPYLLTCSGTIMMFYIMLFITFNKGVMEFSESLSFLLMLGCYVIGIFSAIILFYTNSFLIKQRKKELGLFNILGMGKMHIGFVMAIENLYVAIITLVSGLASGILFSKLMLMLLMKLLSFEVTFGFEISPFAIGVTCLLFCGIFFLTMLFNLGQVHLSKPVELLRGGNTGEKEPKTKWLLAITGFITLGLGYYIAIVTKSPLDAIGLFFIAVLLVIVGTYCLFTAGSIAMLKALRKNKKYYYKTKHFTSVSGMIYRMKQNAAGLASICILSTMVLVMLSTTISMYFGMEDALRVQFPRNVEINAYNISAEDSKMLGDIIDKDISESGTDIYNSIRYRFKNYTLVKDGSRFNFYNDSSYSGSGNPVVFFIPLDEYNRLQGSSEKLAENELLLYSPNAKYTDSKLLFNNTEYSVKSVLDTLNVETYFSIRFSDTFYFIVPSEKDIIDIYHEMKGGTDDFTGMSYYYGFDVSGDPTAMTDIANKLNNSIGNLEYGDNETFLHISCVEYGRQSFLSVYGGLFFLGIFLGTLFIMATVMIMYYKQVSEGYDDKGRFEIMQKVGMSRSEVKKSIGSQVLTVFFLPLVTAGIHIAFAFNIIRKLLAVLNLTNVALFGLCTALTILVFAILYAVVYALTARVYYKIVEQ